MAPNGSAPINPFLDLPAVRIDGRSHDLTTTIAPLGALDRGRVIRVLVESDAVESVLILTSDEQSEEAGVIVGGGPGNEAFEYRIPADGRYFVFAMFDPQAPQRQQRGTITVSNGDADYAPPASQPVVISFAPGFLSDPGLFDPTSGTPDEQAILEDLSDSVRDLILERLRTIFSGTPITIVDERDGLPNGSFSRVTFVPDRQVANDDDVAIDSAIPVDDADAQCNDRVIFGEVLPRGTPLDPGNQILDDDAVVYVGSFQGRGAACRTGATDSVNNIVLGLSQTAAHEIGHLVGLFHVALVDLMDRSPSLAFQRELTFGRDQILTEELVDNGDGSTSLTTTVLTTVIQDPQIYFAGAFGQ